MPINFAASPRSTVGLEWELAIVDRDSGQLSNIAPQLLEDLTGTFPATAFPHFAGELLQNTVELVSAPHSTVAGATADLQQLARTASLRAQAYGTALVGAGSHPFSRWYDQRVTKNERYDRFIDRYQWWGRNMLIWGVHVHVGIDRSERVVPIMNALLTYLPHLLALSCSSPFWAGEATGYASNRTLQFQQLPTAGLPPEVDDWHQLERVLDDLTRTGIIAEPTEARWDVRPAPRWGTIEIRFCDGAATLDQIRALAAIAQCLAEELQRTADAGMPLPRLAPWFVRENKWRTARYGLDTQIITDRHGTQAPLRDEIYRLISRLAPIAASLRCERELAMAANLLAAGTSAERQLATYRQHGGEAAGSSALLAVVDALRADFDSGLDVD